jgi:hypothetical protein
VHGLCPEWIQVSRLQDFINLRRLQVEFCAPWDLEMFEVNNQYQQSLLDLAIGHDTHFDIDFYTYDARSSGEWNVVRPCTFKRVYKFFCDRHTQLLLQGSLVNEMLSRMIIIDPRRRPFSGSNLERPSELERKHLDFSFGDFKCKSAAYTKIPDSIIMDRFGTAKVVG